MSVRPSVCLCPCDGIMCCSSVHALNLLTTKKDLFPSLHIPPPTHTQSARKEAVHLFPFMLPNAEGPLAEVYCRVARLMVAVGTDGHDGQARTALKTGLAEMARSAAQTAGAIEQSCLCSMQTVLALPLLHACLLAVPDQRH